MIVLLAGAGGLALAQTRAVREQEELRRAMQRLAAAMLEQARAEAQLQTLRDIQQAAEMGVALGAQTARSIHMGIAAIPFGILDAIPVTRHPSRLVRTVHDQISGVVYDSISGGNQLLGSALRLGLGQRDKPADDEDKKP
ncbi:MAG TPA: hypothetical protein VNX47_04715 [Nevskia sp.]|nr:hypothetical protein [Nevskia sp.]